MFGWVRMENDHIRIIDVGMTSRYYGSGVGWSGVCGWVG